MISVARNAHMPRVEASCCWARSSNWWATREWPWASPCAGPTGGPACGSYATCDSAGLGFRSVGRSWPAGRGDGEGDGEKAGLCADNFGLLVRVVVRLFGHHGRLLEVLGGRGRRRRPLQAGGVPRVGPGGLAVPQ